jgi:hypothetical protein
VGKHVWECRPAAESIFCKNYEPETSLGYIGWKMTPTYANQKKFDGSGNEDPETVIDNPAPGSDKDTVTHNKAYNEPTQEEVMKLFEGEERKLNKDFELLDEVNNGVFVLQTSLENYWKIFWSDSAPYFHDRFI